MAVYTKLIKKDISSLINNYQINKIEKFKGIKKGIENTNYLLKTKQNKFILTIFEKRVKKKDLPFFMNLMEKLNHKKIICPKPLRTKKGTHITNIKTKSACIVTFLEGKDKTILNNKNCFDVGKNIAKFHKVTAKLKLYRQNSMSIHRLNDLLKTILLTNDGGKLLLISQAKGNMGLNIDSEDTDTATITINDVEALLTEKSNQITITWAYQGIIFTVEGEEDINIMIQISEKLEKVLE